MSVMNARYPGRCRKCGRKFPRRTRIAWAEGRGAWHLACAPDEIKSARSHATPPVSVAASVGTEPAAKTKPRRRIQLAPLFWPVAIIAVVTWIVWGSVTANSPASYNRSPSHTQTHLRAPRHANGQVFRWHAELRGQSSRRMLMARRRRRVVPLT